tara:strand:- start:2635 stop:3108 length:474 start_codon:yes stop_codon:yes gene_type:complete
LNIFALDKDVDVAAKWHVDRHVVKMPLETAQMLCTARYELGCTPESIPYKRTHTNHPCSIWCRQSKANYDWLCKLGLALCKEYTHRYEKVHKCQAVIQDCIDNYPALFPHFGFTLFPQTMEDEYKMNDPIIGYRNYYNIGKAHLHSWKKRPVPYWIG